MSKLYFKYGVMGSSKTAELLMTRFRYQEMGAKVAVLKPKLDTRDGETIIRSRIGLSAEAGLFEDFDFSAARRYDVILVDEAQFLSAKQVDMLAKIAVSGNVPVICYGLRTDFTGHFFEGSQRLFEIADSLTEIKTVCWCGAKALFNARIDETTEEMVTDGDQVCLGTTNYVPLCRKHFLLKMPKGVC